MCRAAHVSEFEENYRYLRGILRTSSLIQTCTAKLLVWAIVNCFPNLHLRQKTSSYEEISVGRRASQKMKIPVVLKSIKNSLKPGNWVNSEKSEHCKIPALIVNLTFIRPADFLSSLGFQWIVKSVNKSPTKWQIIGLWNIEKTSGL